MKSQTAENGVFDQLHHRTLAVMATTVLAEGEMYGTLRGAPSSRKGKFPPKTKPLSSPPTTGV